MLSQARYLGIVKASAWYDLLIILPFVTPWTLDYLYALLQHQHQYWQFQGQFHSLNTMHYLFANLLGSIVLVWSLFRILHPQVLLGRYDAISRWLFSCWQIYAWLHGVSSLILLFTFFEIAFGIAQSLPVRTAAAVSPRAAQSFVAQSG